MCVCLCVKVCDVTMFGYPSDKDELSSGKIKSYVVSSYRDELWYDLLIVSAPYHNSQRNFPSQANTCMGVPLFPSYYILGTYEQSSVYGCETFTG
jgi:hypothetical protein